DELQAWFRDPHAAFSVPLESAATPFQQGVRTALQQIPAGQTRTYGELAARLGSGARAVGNACRHNPFPILVPCHRVVSATGMGGYAGSTEGAELARKRWLLQHEGNARGA
ncbi:MAG: methylated-DNA--[protein]-cysteine S-methyltransferase, partial [Gammaproteobacteria bacterium]